MMKRKIKFRVWDPKDGSWFWAPDELGNMICCSDWDMFNPDDYQFEQFTGLKDKNGKEIYENDLLKFTYPFDKNSTIGQVEWSDKDAGFILGISTLRKIAVKAEVVGNAHEDGQLLGADK